MLEAGKPPPVAILLRAGVTDKQQTLGLLGWCRGLNSGPRDFAASNFNHSAVCLLPFSPHSFVYRLLEALEEYGNQEAKLSKLKSLKRLDRI